MAKNKTVNTQIINTDTTIDAFRVGRFCIVQIDFDPKSRKSCLGIGVHTSEHAKILKAKFDSIQKALEAEGR